MVQKIHPWGVIWVPSSTLRLVTCQKEKCWLSCPVWRCPCFSQCSVVSAQLKMNLRLIENCFFFDKKSFQKRLFLLSIYGTNAFVRISIFARPTYWALFIYPGIFFCNFLPPEEIKGQLISKANCKAENYSKKWSNEFI